MLLALWASWAFVCQFAYFVNSLYKQAGEEKECEEEREREEGIGGGEGRERERGSEGAREAAPACLSARVFAHNNYAIDSVCQQ